MGHHEMETEESLARQWEARCEIAERGLARWHEAAMVWLAAGKRALEERDRAQRHIDAAGDGMNLLALLDEYHDRMTKARRAADAYRRAAIAARRRSPDAMSEPRALRGQLRRERGEAVQSIQRQAAEIDTLRAGLRALANIRDEGAAETHRWRDRALKAEAETAAARHTADDLVSKEASDLAALTKRAERAEADFAQADTALDELIALVRKIEPLVVDSEEIGDRTPDEILEAALAEIQRLGRVIDKLCDGTAAQRLQAARARAKRAEARCVAYAEELVKTRARERAIFVEDENDPDARCRCGRYRGACRVCLALTVHEANDAVDCVRQALKERGGDVDEMSPSEAGEYVGETIDRDRDRIEMLEAEIAHLRQAGGADEAHLRGLLAEARRERDDASAEHERLKAEIAHLKAKRAGDAKTETGLRSLLQDAQYDRRKAWETIDRVTALCRADLDRPASIESHASRSLAWSVLRELGVTVPGREPEKPATRPSCNDHSVMARGRRPQNNARAPEAVRLNVLLMAKEHAVVAQCLQHDITVQGRTEAEAKLRFSQALAVRFLHDVSQKRKPLSTLRMAPRVYWEMYLTGRAQEQDLPIYVPAEAGRQWDARATFTLVGNQEARLS